jgi:glycosyltransferase involved in cell wall biosynthesis
MARICLIRQGHYPQDTRLGKEVEALVGAGHEVDIICGGTASQPRSERDGHIEIHRVPIARGRGNPLRYALRYGTFLVAATFLAGRLHLRHRYDLVQVNSLPDFLVFAALVPRLLGARVLLNLLECMPEFFAMKYRLPARHLLVRSVKLVERASIAFADRVITCNDPMRDTFLEHGAPADKVAVIMLSADEATFDPTRFPTAPKGPADPFVISYHGTLEESLGADTVVRAVGLLKDEIPGLRLRIFGDGTLRPVIESLVRELGLDGRVLLARGFVPIPELLEGIASADAGVVPTKRNPYRDLTHSSKMFDLIAMRKPAIVARTRSVEAYFDDSCLQLFESADERDLARAIRELYADPDLRERLVRRATEVSEPYRWVHQRARYLAIVAELISRAGARPARPAVVAEGVRDA